MKLQVTRLQIYGFHSLLSNLQSVSSKGLATIRNIEVLYNSRTPDLIYVKYEKAEAHSDQYGFMHILISIDKQGNVSNVGEKFQDIFAISSFLSECKPIDMNNINDYLID